MDSSLTSKRNFRNNSPRFAKRRRAPRTKNRVRAKNTTPNHLVLTAPPQYRGDRSLTLQVRGATQIVSTGATMSFAINAALGNPNLQVSDWTDQVAYWDEYVIMRSTVHIWCITPPVTGSSRFWLQVNNTGVPSASDAEGRLGVIFTTNSNNRSQNHWQLNWVNQDLNALEYRATNVDYVYGYFKGYTDAPNFGTTAVNSALYQTRTYYQVRLRGRRG